MAFMVQNDAPKLLGTRANLPNPTTLRESWTAYQCKDTGELFVLSAFSNPAANVWIQVVGAVVPENASWAKYVVAPPSGPLAPYNTPQDAITAAVGDGHGANLPAVVLVHPGGYSGNVAMVPGIDVVGLSQNPLDTTISGTVTAAGLTAPTQIRNLRVIGSISMTGGAQFLTLDNVSLDGNLVFSGTGQTLVVVDSVVTASSGDAISVSASDDTSSITLLRTTVGAASGQCLNVTSVCSIKMADSNLPGLITGVAATLSSPSDDIRRTAILGQVVLSSLESAFFEDTDISVLSQPAMTFNGESLATFMGGSLQRFGTPGFVTSGTGGNNSLSYDQISLSTSGFLATGVETTGLESARPFTKSAYGPTGSVQIGTTDGDVVVLSPTGPVAVTLPPIVEYGDGREITVKNNGGGTATVSPNSGDTMDTAPVVLVAGAVHGVTFRADVPLTVWDTVSKF